MIVGDGKGVWKARSGQRKPLGERWNPETLNMVRHPPWRTSDEDPNMDGEMPEVTKNTGPVGESCEIEPELIKVPRRVYCMKEDFGTHGFSGRCPCAGPS